MSEAVERERLDVDILFVGAGPATLAAAIRLVDLCREKGRDLPAMLVIEKASEIGEHQLSGAVMKPNAIAELMPDYREKGFPYHYEVTKDRFYFFTRKRAIRPPITPPQFANHGNLVVSLSDVVKWLAEQAEGREVEIYPGFPAARLLFADGRVAGVQIQDRGVDKDGKPKSVFEPGPEIHARCVVLGEGPRGSCTRQLLERFPDLQGPNPQVFATGIKEIWRIKPENHVPGRVIHTMGWPADPETFGGSWIYDLKDSLVSIGFVTGLDASSPYNDPHDNMQRFKLHPFMRRLLNGGEIVRYGAKTIPEGGLFSQPRLYGDGVLIVGDSASLCNGEKLKGVHMALKSGMLAAETLYQALEKDDFSSATLSRVQELYRASWAYAEHRRSRNFHAAWKWVHRMPPWLGWVRQLPFVLNTGVSMLTGGRGLQARITAESDHTHYHRISELTRGELAKKEKVAYDNRYTFDKVTAVAHAGARHEVDQPHHLVVADPELCSTRCAEEYDNPCEHFCPAAVYEMIDDEMRPGRKKLVIHHENCVHCKTCDIADPYQVITWTTPEGGDGPDYTQM
ncbi:MAG: 4Fe-4S dicluster domain-containing protein [Myxococcota bacterium]